MKGRGGFNAREREKEFEEIKVKAYVLVINENFPTIISVELS